MLEAPPSPSHKTLVTEDMRNTARAMRLALESFIDLRSTMPLQYVVAFLRVVEDEGRGVTEYAREAETSKTVMTRYLLDLGERDRHGEEGFNLIFQKRDTHDLRVHRAYVTFKGAGLMSRARRALELLVRK